MFMANSRPAPVDRPYWDANPLGLRDATVSHIPAGVPGTTRRLSRSSHLKDFTETGREVEQGRVRTHLHTNANVLPERS
jgi:hypothetical protein